MAAGPPAGEWRGIVVTMRGAVGRALLGAGLAAAAVVAGYAAGMLAGRGADGSALEPVSGGANLGGDWLEIAAPDAAFRTLDGGTARLSDYRGQIVLLNFWGSWCAPCLVEIPHLIEVQEILAAHGGTIIGPAVDSGGPDDVRRFARQAGINYPVWMSDYETAVGRFGAAGYPYTLLIDRDGVIRRQYLGPQTARTLLRDIGSLVARDAGAAAGETAPVPAS